MAQIHPDKAIATLKQLQQSSNLSIVKLSEPLTSTVPSSEYNTRNSDASCSSLDGPTPASLEADLTHYAELFSKLRFSYVEQVTKEKFIRAIVGDPPLIVTLQENLDLEKQNAEAKAQLKNLKTDVGEMIETLERKGRELSRQHETIQHDTAKLEELPPRITGLEAHVEDLCVAHEISGSQDPNLSMPLEKTRTLLTKRQSERQELARELEALQSRVPRKRKELERLEAELGPLEVKRQNSSLAAKEARRRKAAALGGAGDDLEQKARWWRANEAVLRKLLHVKT